MVVLKSSYHFQLFSFKGLAFVEEFTVDEPLDSEKDEENVIVDEPLDSDLEQDEENVQDHCHEVHQQKRLN